MAGEWSRATGRLGAWRPDQADADQVLDDIAADHVRVLHRTLRADPSAFGLHEAVCTAGERLASALGALSEAGPGGADSTDTFLARFTGEVGGDGGTLADAAVRRAAASAAQRLLDHLEADDDSTAGLSGLAGDLLCLLYRWFFADVVAEFLRAVVAEQVRLAVPLPPALDPEDRIPEWIAGHVLRLVPSPCEEAAYLSAGSYTAEAGVDGSAGPLPEIARTLVPRSAGRVLGLITDDGEEAA
ncbi:hypothetical protein [Streptomyces pactum]|uniref:hypothetical protein n=1 Tax=Streptomyces pactum TaxID=68249 RepID=UPI0036FC7AB9